MFPLVLRIGKVEEGLRLAPAENLEFGVARDSDDLELAVFLARHPEGVSNRILFRPEFSRRGLADNGHIPAVIIVRIGKAAPARRSMPITSKYSGETTLKLAPESVGIRRSGSAVDHQPVAAIVEVPMGTTVAWLTASTPGN